MTDLPPGYFTAAELAVLLKVTEGHIRNLAHRHKWRRARAGNTVGYDWLAVSDTLQTIAPRKRRPKVITSR